MSLDTIALLVVAFLVLAATSPIVVYQVRKDRRAKALVQEARTLGSHETVSLHPRVDEGLCIGCGECVKHCPEQDVLTTIRNKAVVAHAVECVGHGICERVCPVGAITLVIGTETRGAEIPRLTEHFETNVPGLYVVGELGGMGLIRNAVWQASQAVQHLARGVQRGSSLDLLVVGAGPAGLAAALVAQQLRLRFRIVEQETLGGSILHYPRKKLVMTHPVELPGVGQIPFREVEKEPLLEFWLATLARKGIEVEEGVRLERVERGATGFLAHTTAGPIEAARVVLALGRRGTPRRLGVPGEELSKVAYRLIEPEAYDGRSVVVVGGGSSALEAAMSLAERPRTFVTLCHRRADFSGARPALVQRVLALESEGMLEILREARVARIERASIHFDVKGRPDARDNDFVFVLAGGVPPHELLEKCGVDLETRFGTPLLRPA
ncbi:MAG TPA: NAD(P)-binding domain-containing protein [Gemmatimonadales bacterium]|nr:NAD(P)-binding domain-containing protein [Gemmatimonadales bacterium]